METTKSIWQSRSVIGSVIAIIALLASMRGYTIDQATQVQIIDYLTQIIGVIGAGVALWGRVVATHKLTV